MENSVSPLTQMLAQQKSVLSSILPLQKGSHSPPPRSASIDHTTPSQANSNYSASINGNHPVIDAVNQDIEDNTEDNNDELTPPPDSPIEELMSCVPSVQPNTLEDEIVVGTNTNNNKPPPFRVMSEAEDIAMADVEPDATPSTGNQSKRKRVSAIYAESVVSAIYAESVDNRDDSPAPTEDQGTRRPPRPSKAHGVGGVKGVMLGYWRDSPPEVHTEKHGVVGFIDSRDRLRTRIQPTTRDGQRVDPRYPIPGGPGGSWVTFDKVAFDPQLVGRNHHVVKEYVKIRVEDGRQGDTPEEEAKLGHEAAGLAAERVRTHPPPETATQPLVAYGAEIPSNAVFPNRPESKKRRLAGSLGGPSDSPGQLQNQNPLDNIPGTRPTRILVGYWKFSSEPDPVDKHAVLGVLASNDGLRVKLIRETRDGRPVFGNFPSGAGALWIQWDELELEPHLKGLVRAEVREYCRIRQYHLDNNETEDQRIANETAAVIEARQRVALGVPVRKDNADLPGIAMKRHTMTNGNGNTIASSTLASTLVTAKPDEPDTARRSENGGARPGRRPLFDIEFRAANRGPPTPNRRTPGPSVLERTNSLARREIARLEAAQARADLRAASREASLDPAAAASSASSNKALFKDNVTRLDKVWVSQEVNRIKAGGEDTIIYGGTKYERKQSGPFEGKLVSHGQIISIDGEDYVEYKVLTKPTFF
ncbi:hypothetical protein BT67DRAFT_479917 [Trichocladium antarcticum]|uniref:Uncharacterized protein n=1 Tax=Trichocladium antarcticum TaxID=1450529 RepID=A0AAN6UH54_9PEZI|nr:hypothetical protein BT67DRAFT_479917 [Trichocladium antarcticum]